MTAIVKNTQIEANQESYSMRIACFVVTLISLSLPLMMSGAESPAVQLVGLQVVGPGYGLNGSEIRAFHRQSGTTIALLIQNPENKKIVDVDDSKCALLGFTDDLGNDLMDGVDWGGFPQISKDGRQALIEATSKKRPSQGASRLFLKGRIHIRVATSESTEQIDRLKLEVGTKASVLQEVVQVMKVKEENEGLDLVLQISRKFKDRIKDIRFYSENGNPIDIWGRGSLTFGNAAQVEYNLNTKSKPRSLKVEIDLWQGLEKLNFPFQVESTMGF
jgi:hypothetical protein